MAVSMALWKDGAPIVAVTIDVARNDEYVAVVGEGATLNHSPVHVSDTATLDNCLVAPGFHTTGASTLRHISKWSRKS